MLSEPRHPQPLGLLSGVLNLQLSDWQAMISATQLCSRDWTQFAFYRNITLFYIPVHRFPYVYSVKSLTTMDKFGNKGHLVISQYSNWGEHCRIQMCQSRQLTPFTMEVKALFSPDFVEQNLINNPIDGVWSLLYGTHMFVSQCDFFKWNAMLSTILKWIFLLTLNKEAVSRMVSCSSFGDSRILLPLPTSWLDFAHIPQFVLRSSARELEPQQSTLISECSAEWWYNPPCAPTWKTLS